MNAAIMTETMHIPLFPLNTVLFPGMPLRLHVFEPRYKAMVEDCLRNELPFGVVLIRNGSEALGPLPDPHPIGTTAYIAEIDDLPLDRRLLLATGRERFAIQSLDTRLSYLTAEVEKIPMNPGDARSLANAAERLKPNVTRYLGMLEKVGQATIESSNLPHDPVELGFLAASVLNIPADDKQALLAADKASTMVAELANLYRKEVALMETLIQRGVHENKSDFSLN